MQNVMYAYYGILCTLRHNAHVLSPAKKRALKRQPSFKKISYGRINIDFLSLPPSRDTRDRESRKGFLEVGSSVFLSTCEKGSNKHTYIVAGY